MAAISVHTVKNGISSSRSFKSLEKPCFKQTHYAKKSKKIKNKIKNPQRNVRESGDLLVLKN